jgi:hypothetical protein
MSVSSSAEILPSPLNIHEANVARHGIGLYHPPSALR